MFEDQFNNYYYVCSDSTYPDGGTRFCVLFGFNSLKKAMALAQALEDSFDTDCDEDSDVSTTFVVRRKEWANDLLTENLDLTVEIDENKWFNCQK